MKLDFTNQPGLTLNKKLIQYEENPLVSIVTPFYNSGQNMIQTFNCVMNQTFPWFEWIIINDGSTNEADIGLLKELSEKNNRIKLISTPNHGVAAARNYGIQMAVSDIIIPLDADDLIMPTFVETTYWGLYYHPNASWCYTDSVSFGSQEYFWKKDFNAEELKSNNFLVNCAAIRKKDLLEVDGYEENIQYIHEDWHLWLKFLSKSKFPIHQQYYGFWYRRSNSGRMVTVEQELDNSSASSAMKILADKTDITVKAVQYPNHSKVNVFDTIKKSSFDKKISSEQNQIQILMLLPWLVMGGADYFNLSLVSKMNQERFKISIITTEESENLWKSKFEDYISDIFDLPTFLDCKYYAEFISYFITSRKIDVLFLSNSYYGYYLLPWLRANFPDLVIIDYVHMEEWYWRNGGFARTSGTMGKLLEKSFVCNERTRQVFINQFDRNPESVSTLYIGVDKERYNAEKIEPGLAKKMLGIKPSRPCVLFPCRIHPQKRPFLLLEIAKMVRNIRDDIAFIVVGDGPQLDEVKEKCKQSHLEHTVYFANRQEDMRCFYKDAAITLICSLKEGLALTAYESCSMSVPVITSDVGGQAELIDDSVGKVVPLLQEEENALDTRVFSDEEIQLYVKNIVDILADSDHYRQICKNCRKKIEERFSDDIMIHTLEKELIELCSDETRKKSREQISLYLNPFYSILSDYAFLYLGYERKEKEADEIWNAKVCLENECVILREQLNEIYNMRIWKFVDKNPLRKIFDRLRGKFFRLQKGNRKHV